MRLKADVLADKDRSFLRGSGADDQAKGPYSKDRLTHISPAETWVTPPYLIVTVKAAEVVIVLLLLSVAVTVTV
jgi:hypothetical protein